MDAGTRAVLLALVAAVGAAILGGVCAAVDEADKAPPKWVMKDDSKQELPPLILKRNSSTLMSVLPTPATLTINSAKGPLVIIELATGKAQLFGDPNEAARRFWAAVSTLAPPPCTKETK